MQTKTRDLRKQVNTSFRIQTPSALLISSTSIIVD